MVTTRGPGDCWKPCPSRSAPGRVIFGTPNRCRATCSRRPPRRAPPGRLGGRSSFGAPLAEPGCGMAVRVSPGTEFLYPVQRWGPDEWAWFCRCLHQQMRSTSQNHRGIELGDSAPDPLTACGRPRARIVTTMSAMVFMRCVLTLPVRGCFHNPRRSQPRQESEVSCRCYF